MASTPDAEITRLLMAWSDGDREALDSRQAQIVELRFFGGLDLAENAWNAGGLWIALGDPGRAVLHCRAARLASVAALQVAQGIIRKKPELAAQYTDLMARSRAVQDRTTRS